MRQTGKRFFAVLLSTVMSIGLAGGALADETPKVALVIVAPDDVGAGTTTGFQVSLQNLADPQQLGSANVTAPDGFVLKSVTDPAGPATATVSGRVVQLRNLALPPGQTVMVTATAVAPCIAGSYNWSARVKQSNGFSGPPGNDFAIDPSSQLTTTVSGTCSVGFSSVGFSGNPTTSVKNQTITAATLDPTTGAPSVRVGLFDDDGFLITEPSLQTTVTVAIGNNPGGGTLSGDKVEPTSSGVATFDDLSIDKTGLGYTLTSTPSDDEIASGESTGFNVVDSGGVCHANGCSHSASLGGTTADLFSNSTEDGYNQFLALNVENVDCDGYTEVSAVVTFGVSAETGQAQVTLTVRRQGLPASRRSLNSFMVCYGSPKPFQARGGGPAPSVGDEFVALLPECADTTPVAGSAPCVIGRSMTTQTFSITFSTPLGDPKARG
jgi:hypothetical protein